MWSLVGVALIVIVIVAVVSALWGYNRAYAVMSQEIQQKSYFVSDGCVYIAKPQHNGENTDYSYPPLDPGALAKIKSLSKKTKDSLTQEHALRQFTDISDKNYKSCCVSCLSKDGVLIHVVVCAMCGNKRCPKAQNHMFKCTNSNAVGQICELEVFYIGVDLGD